MGYLHALLLQHTRQRFAGPLYEGGADARDGAKPRLIPCLFFLVGVTLMTGGALNKTAGPFF